MKKQKLISLFAPMRVVYSEEAEKLDRENEV